MISPELELDILRRQHERLADACCRLLKSLDVDNVIITDAINSIAEQVEKESPSDMLLARLFQAGMRAAL